jgi:trans-2,3-dihydro-3-hydroxyanthranilate isomerase
MQGPSPTVDVSAAPAKLDAELDITAAAEPFLGTVSCPSPDDIHASALGREIHLYARTAGRKEQVDLRARMFSPLGGTIEDPATGSANGALVALLASLEPAASTVLSFDVLQGVEMGRPSLLAVSAEKQGGSIVRVRVGGRCTPVMEGALTV